MGRSARNSLGDRIEECDIGRDEGRGDTFVVVDDGYIYTRTLAYAAVARIRQTLIVLLDHTQVELRVRGRKRGEARSRVVGRVVVHHDTLPLLGRRILLHDRFERVDQPRGTVVGGYQ